MKSAFLFFSFGVYGFTFLLDRKNTTKFKRDAMITIRVAILPFTREYRIIAP